MFASESFVIVHIRHQLGLHVHGRDSTLTKYLTEPLHQLYCYVFNFEKVMLDQERSLDPTVNSNSVSEVVLRIFFWIFLDLG